MSPQMQLCPFCGAHGKDGQIWVHSRVEGRYRCQVCGRTFTDRHGTALYRLKKPALFPIIISLLAGGCPIQAIVTTFRLSDKTVRT